jgi:hypothetical protein
MRGLQRAVASRTHPPGSRTPPLSEMLPSLVRARSAPLRRLVSTFSSTLAVLPRVPHVISSGGNLNLPFSAHPSPARDGPSGPAGGAQRGISFSTRAVDARDEAASSSAAADSDLSAPYLSVRIRCRRHDVVSSQYLTPSQHFVATSISCPSPPSSSFSVSCIFFFPNDIAKQEVLSEALLSFGASSVTVDDISDAENLDEVSIVHFKFAYYSVHIFNCNRLG